MSRFLFILIASNKPLMVSHLAHLENFIEDNSLGLSDKPKWLKKNHAAEISVRNKPNISHIQSLREALSEDCIDVFVIPETNRLKRLLISDMDSTIVEGETLDEIADKAGIKDKVSQITESAMRGEIDFNESLKKRVSFLKSQPESLLNDVLNEINLNSGAEALVSIMNHTDATTVLVSGGFTFFTEAIARKIGFEHHHGNILDIKNGKILGTVTEPIVDSQSKYGLLIKYRESLNLSKEDTLAVGDGANDLPMLLEAGLGIGYKPKPIVLESVDNCIIHTDLSSILYLQGFLTEQTLN
jgi:phosphoserine phosphatase